VGKDFHTDSVVGGLDAGKVPEKDLNFMNNAFLDFM